jgi:hypothetical protein
MTIHNEQPAPAPRFEFFEKVRVTATDAAKCHMNGRVGTVLGRTLTDDETSWLYAVSIELEENTWSLLEDELESTGEYSSRDEFYDGTSLRVRVDEKGRGTAVPKKELGDDS